MPWLFTVGVKVTVSASSTSAPSWYEPAIWVPMFAVTVLEARLSCGRSRCLSWW